METFGQKARAYLYALLVHVVVIASLFIGLLWSRTATPVATPGPVIEAEIVGAAAAPRPRSQSKPRPSAPKPAPAPEPPKPEPPKAHEAQPPTVQHNDKEDQEKIAEIAEQKAEQAKRAQDEKHRQQQVELDEQKKRDEAEAKQKAKQAEIQKELEDLRKQREKAAKQTLLAKEKMKQLDDLQKQQSAPKKAPPAEVPEAETPKTGMNGNDASKSAEYYSAIQLAVTNNWLRPDNAPAGLSCRVHIVQIPGGTVISATVIPPCSVDVATRTSIQQAVMKASPLPYNGYEKEFKREIVFDFSYDGR